MTSKDLNEDYMKHTKYLHLSGITPALSESCYEMMNEAVRIAKKHQIKIIFDPNLRKSLWTEEKARNVLLEFVRKSDIVLPGVAEGTFLFKEENPEILGELFLKQGPTLVVMKVGAKGAYYFTNEDNGLVPGFPVTELIDPVGAGDAFCAGFISGLLDGLSVYDSIRRGNGTGAMVTMVNGDVEGLPELQELNRFMNGTSSDDVTR